MKIAHVVNICLHSKITLKSNFIRNQSYFSKGMSEYLTSFVSGHGISFETNYRDPDTFERANKKWMEIETNLTVRSNESSILMFCGAKNNGKSSLVRYILNSYNCPRQSTRKALTSNNYAYYIDFDPGQPEMTTPGLVSAHIIRSNEQPLVSPTYLNLNQHQPLVVSCVGGLNMSVNPRTYIENCRFVFRQVIKHRDQQPIKKPVYINTMGFIRGVGLAMLLDLLKICKPTNLVVLNIVDDAMRTIHADLTPDAVDQTKASFYRESHNPKASKLEYKCDIHNLDFVFPDSTSVATKNRTALQLAYFAHVPESLYKPILHIMPKWMSLEAVSIHCVSSYPLKPVTVLEILNQSWVHLVKLKKSPKKGAVRIESAEAKTPEIVCNMVDDIVENTMYGCGIVSAIDMEKKTIGIITPLDQSVLNCDIDCIIKPLSLQVPLNSTPKFARSLETIERQ